MTYYRGKDIEKSRGNVVQEVILEKKYCKGAEPYTSAPELIFQVLHLRG
jgi:hypothetical protein